MTNNSYGNSFPLSRKCLIVNRKFHFALTLREGTLRNRMRDANTYRSYADDCRRIAEKMNAKDKAALLKMAEVWDKQAEEAERLENNPKRAR